MPAAATARPHAPISAAGEQISAGKAPHSARTAAAANTTADAAARADVERGHPRPDDEAGGGGQEVRRREGQSGGSPLLVPVRGQVLVGRSGLQVRCCLWIADYA